MQKNKPQKTAQSRHFKGFLPFFTPFYAFDPLFFILYDSLHRCEFVVGDTTAALPAIAAVPHAQQIHPDRQIGFHSDPSISRIFQAESILGTCDAVDMDILRLIIKGYPYFDIAEILHVSESTVKYRLKRLLTVSGFGSRDELLSAMKAFLI